ncbi:MAG: hypothetical protein K2N88_04305 [Muribaculaceae bacterium]|nr:hypothetical protein [Muribaculaceae bacterium]
MTNPLFSVVRRMVRQLAEWQMISPRRAALLLHRIETRRRADIKNPTDLNEKILWLEFNTDTTLWSRLADKYEVKKFVADAGFPEIVPATYGIWEDAEAVDFSQLPDKFAIKSTHGTMQTILVRDRRSLDQTRVRRRLSQWLGRRFGFAGAEPHYTRIRPRIMAEEMLPLSDEAGSPVMATDYKFFCFDGRPLYCLVCSERDEKTFRTSLSLFRLPAWEEWREAVVESYRPVNVPPRPDKLEEMIHIAETLSQGFPIVRVDLYCIGARIYFGELTFTMGSARIRYFTPSALASLGSLISLPQ